MPPRVSGGVPLFGHGLRFLADPESVLERGLREHGAVYSIDLVGRQAAVVIGSRYSDFFFRGDESVLAVNEAKAFMARMFEPDFYLLAEEETYLRHRALVRPLFATTSLPGHLVAIDAEVREWVDGLGDGGQFDLEPELGPLTLRIASRAYLGERFADEFGGLYKDFKRLSAGMDPVLPDWFPAPRLVRGHRSRNRLRRQVAAYVRERRARPHVPEDFLQRLAGARFPDGEQVPENVVVSMITFLMFAGFHTVVAQTSWALVDLARHPGERERVVAELDRHGAPRHTLALADLRRFQHLDRCLRESGRLHPAAHVLGRVVKKPVRLDDYELRPGGLVLTSPVLSNQVEDDFPLARSFRPDRFLEDPASASRVMWFGHGRHRCVGTAFAMLVMKTIVGRLLDRFDLELLDPDPRPNHGAEVRAPRGPCRLRYRLRA